MNFCSNPHQLLGGSWSRSWSGFRSWSGWCSCFNMSWSGSGDSTAARSGWCTARRCSVAAGRSWGAASGSWSTAGVDRTAAAVTANSGTAAAINNRCTAAGAADAAARSTATAGVNWSAANWFAASGCGATATISTAEERLRVLGVEHRQGDDGYEDGSHSSKLTTHHNFSQNFSNTKRRFELPSSAKDNAISSAHHR